MSPVPSLYDEAKIGGWVSSLENIIKTYNKNITLGIVFEYQKSQLKIFRDGVTYYPVNLALSTKEKLGNKLGIYDRWKALRPYYLNAIEDFKPDIIQCFGSEWPYGLVTEGINIPVVIHMQGFLNINNKMSEMAFGSNDYRILYGVNIYRLLGLKKGRSVSAKAESAERNVMRMNRYFMGRTEWDKKIVRYYSPNSKYYYCPEAIRPAIYNSQVKWEYDARHMDRDKKMRIVTISQAGDLKGNEIILKTADFLKNQMNFNFEWRVAGNTSTISKYEFKSAIDHKNVGIELLGMISAVDVAKELKNAEVYVHPSIIDNSPNSLCEAQLIGTPVIATNVGGIPQLVEDRKSGLLYPYNEFHTLAFMLMDIHGKKELLEKMSKNEIIISHERHDPQRLSETIEEIYSNIIMDYRGNK